MAKSNNTPQPFQTNAVMTDTILNNQTLTIKAPATLANAIVAFEFYLNGNPVTTGVSGSLSITGKWRNGRNRSLGTTNLATTDFTTVSGLFSSFTFSLTGLVGADSVVVSVVQYSNVINIPSSADGGATSLTVVSPNSSIVETAPSTYNGLTRTITAYLQAVGDGGGVADYTKYNYPITCKNTPTFAAGEEYILAIGQLYDSVNFQLVYSSTGSTAPTPVDGNVTFEFILSASAGAYNNADVTLKNVQYGGQLAAFSPSIDFARCIFKVYQLANQVVVNGVTLLAGTVVYTFIFNATLGYNGTKAVSALVSTNNALNSNTTNGAINPNNAAILGIVSGLSFTQEANDNLTAVRTISPNVIIPALKSEFVNSPNTIWNVTYSGWQKTLWNTTQITKKYLKYFFIDPDNGSDTNTAANNGSMNAPFKTVAYAQTIMPQGSIGVILGKTTEAAVTLTKPNIDWVTFGTRSALAGFTNKVTVNNTVAGSSIRFTGLSFDGGLDIASTNTGGVYVYNGQIGATGFNKNNATGYCEFVGVDASNGANNIKGGTLSVAGGKLIAPIITGTGTQVYIDNAGSIIGNTTVATGCYLFIYEQNWIAGTTGFAVSAVAGSYVFIENTNFVRPDGSLATVSILGYRSGSNWNYNTTGSALSADSLVVSAIDFFDRIGFSKAPSTITTATKMLVRNPTTNEISEQLIPTATVIPVQFNVPAGTLYTSTTAPQAIPLKSSSGSTQSTQLAQVCNSNGLITLDQIFSASIAPGQTLTFRGQITVYNQVAITTSNYYVVVQPVGVMADSGVWVNLVDSTNVTLSQNAYAYNKVPFSGTFTNNTSTPLDAIGVRMQIIYGVADATAIIDTLFIEGSIS